MDTSQFFDADDVDADVNIPTEDFDGFDEHSFAKGGFAGEESAGGVSPTLIVLIVVFGTLFLFIAVHVGLWCYAQQTIPKRPKKKISIKQQKRRRLREGVQLPSGD
eukprot:jgi/Chlat1/4435/Chrsp29S04395